MAVFGPGSASTPNLEPIFGHLMFEITFVGSFPHPPEPEGVHDEDDEDNEDYDHGHVYDYHDYYDYEEDDEEDGRDDEDDDYDYDHDYYENIGNISHTLTHILITTLVCSVQ